MTPQQLKNSILQLAVQGKLVEQRPEEGTGEELFREIQAEKARLVKAGKIKKEKPLPEIAEDELPFEIPGNWKWVRLEMLATINGGYAFKSTDYSTEGVRVIRISDFNENGFVNTKIVRHPYRKEFEQFLLNKNNILLCMTGGTVGKSLFVTELNEIMMVNQRVATIKIQFALPEYINFNILAPLIQSIIQHSKNSTNDNISMETIKSFPIPLPPLAEQKRIVAKIEELLPLVDRYEKAWTQLEAYNKRFPADMQKAILQWAIQGKLVEQRPEEGTGEELYREIVLEKKRLIREKKIRDDKELPEPDEVPFDIPDSWKWARITDCGSFISGYTPKPNELTTTGRVPYFKVADMNTEGNEIWLTKTDAFLKETNPKKYYLRNTIVYPKNGGAVFTNKKRILAQDSVVDLNTGGYTVFAPMYLMYVFVYFSLIDFKQCYKGTALPTIDMDKLKKRWVPIPPLAEQKRIVAKIEELLPLCDALKGKVS